MSVLDTGGFPYKIAVHIDKHQTGDTSLPPDEVVDVEQWYEADGTEVHDPIRIAELTALTAPKQEP